MKSSSPPQAYFLNYWSDEVLTAVNNLPQQRAFCNCTIECNSFQEKQRKTSNFRCFGHGFRAHPRAEKPLEKIVTCYIGSKCHIII